MLVIELESGIDEIEDEGIAVVVSAVEGGEVEPPKTQTSPEPRGICEELLDTALQWHELVKCFTTSVHGR